MSDNQKDATPFESQIIDARTQWFDPIGIRFILNLTDRPLEIRFSHNIRAVEMIAITDPEIGDQKSEEFTALEGEIIEEDV